MVEDGFALVPEKFRHLVKNVAFLVEDEPSEEVRKDMELGEGETLLGLYRGVPRTERGSDYGVGTVLPDTITLYQAPIEAEAEEMGGDFKTAVRRVVAETVWHEVAHYFGLDEHEVSLREEARKISC